MNGASGRRSHRKAHQANSGSEGRPALPDELIPSADYQGAKDALHVLDVFPGNRRRTSTGGDRAPEKRSRGGGEGGDRKTHSTRSRRTQATTTATTVRMKEGKAITLDGPFAETKEQLAGFYILEC